jgi:asparagine synthetase B (glutamine-hydrolysing)
LLSEGRLWEAGKEVLYHLRQFRSKQRRIMVPFRKVAKRILNGMPFAQYLHRTPQPPAWLTSSAAQHISKKRDQNTTAMDRLDGITGLFMAQNCAMGSIITSKDKLELRSPYRDHRLVEFMLAIPSYQNYRHGMFRAVLRRAMRGILPEVIRTRSGKTGLTPLYYHGLQQKRKELEIFFSVPYPIWKEYVNENWFASRWETVFSPEQDGAEKVVPWVCVTFLLWYQYFNSYS